MVETRVAVIAIIIENELAVEQINLAIHEYARYVIGRMGIPYHKMGINVISLVMDAPQNAISALAGKIGRFEGVSVKTAYSNIRGTEDTGK